MVTGHEDRTYELTDFEKNTLLPLVMKSWSKKQVGELVNMSDMINGMNKYCEAHNITKVNKKGKKRPFKVTGVRMRKLIHHIRVEGLIKNLVANSKGYFITNDKAEIAKFAKSCRERANSFEQVYVAMIQNNNITMRN